jgi:hypothetical protein
VKIEKCEGGESGALRRSTWHPRGRGRSGGMEADRKPFELYQSIIRDVRKVKLDEVVGR